MTGPRETVEGRIAFFRIPMFSKSDWFDFYRCSVQDRMALALVKERGGAVVMKEAGVAVKHLHNSLSHRIIPGLAGEGKRQWYQKLRLASPAYTEDIRKECRPVSSHHRREGVLLPVKYCEHLAKSGRLLKDRNVWIMDIVVRLDCSICAQDAQPGVTSRCSANRHGLIR